MSAIDNLEIDPIRNEGAPDVDGATLVSVIQGNTVVGEGKAYPIRKPTRILHFSDGVLEDYGDSGSDDEDEPDKLDMGLVRCRRANTEGVQPEPQPPIDPKTLSWPNWIQHFTTVGGSRTLHFMESVGESIAYSAGITAPKYHYEIDEYNRAQARALAKKDEDDTEMTSWGTPGHHAAVEFSPVVQQVVPEEPLLQPKPNVA